MEIFLGYDFRVVQQGVLDFSRYSNEWPIETVMLSMLSQTMERHIGRPISNF